MRLRTLALALALSFGITSMADAAAKRPKVHRYKSPKIKKDKRFKQSKLSTVKRHKAVKIKPAHK
jgi:hypothetical protein